MKAHVLITIAALALMSGVAAGAFGAHALKQVLSADMQQIWKTAALYQMIHALGIIGIVALTARFDTALLNWAATLMIAGIVLFSGSLYILALSGTKWIGALTPLGGLCFIVSWALVALAAWRHG